MAFHPGPAVQREQGGKGPALLCLVNLVSLTDQGVKDRVQQGESSTMERKLKGKRKGGEAGVELSGRALCSHESSPGLNPSQHDYFESLLSVLQNLQLQLTTDLPSSLRDCHHFLVPITTCGYIAVGSSSLHPNRSLSSHRLPGGPIRPISWPHEIVQMPLHLRLRPSISFFSLKKFNH